MFLIVMNQQGLIGRFVCENKFQIKTFISDNCGSEDEKTSRQIFIKQKLMIQLCVDISVLDLLVLC